MSAPQEASERSPASGSTVPPPLPDEAESKGVTVLDKVAAPPVALATIGSGPPEAPPVCWPAGASPSDAPPVAASPATAECAETAAQPETAGPGILRRCAGAIRSSGPFVCSALTHAALMLLLGSWYVALEEAPERLVVEAVSTQQESIEDTFPLDDLRLQPELLDIDRFEFVQTEGADDELNLGAMERIDPLETTDGGGLLDPDALANFGGNLLATGGKAGQGAGTGDGLYNASFDGMVEYVRENGLDVVLTFDSTGSMSGEINAVKQRILQIGSTLLAKVPETRIGLCTYRDLGDAYVVKGLPLTNDLTEVIGALSGVRAGGGGDTPEAVHYGLQWSISNNTFRSGARKVILLFGDAPPHPKDVNVCLALARQFHEDQGGIVSTISCRNMRGIPEFVAIARFGGGEAFLLNDHRRIMEELLVLMFGNKHRAEVMKFFDLQGMPGDIPAGVGEPRLGPLPVPDRRDRRRRR